MEFKFAHFSDVHLSPLPAGELFQRFALKRVLGGASWHWRRKAIHKRKIANALLRDIADHKPDEIAFTGDLVNTATQGEFDRGVEWMKSAAAIAPIAFVPGNHDSYVRFPAELGLDRISMFNGSAAYPFVHMRRNVAFIGVSSSCPQSLFKAGGTLGPQQLNSLAVHLRDLQARGFYRVVLIHHPPLPGLAKARKALTDAEALRKVLIDCGAELVLHGHNHHRMLNWLDTPTGAIPICGTPSASSSGAKGQELAEWTLYSVERSRGRWRTMRQYRSYNPKNDMFEGADSAFLEYQQSNG